MRKIEFLAVILCLMIGVGMMASPAGADVIGLGINEIHFYNYETLFTPVEWDTQGNVTKYKEVDFTGLVSTIEPGDILLGIIGVQDVITNGSLYWVFSAADQLSGVFAQKVAEVIPPDNGVPAGNPTPGGNQYDIINDWDNQPRIIFEAANTTATFETLTNETFTLGLLGLAGNEMIALYHDTGATPLETNGSIVDDIAKATDGSLWATFGYNVGGEAGMTDNQPAGDSDDNGYYYSYTSLFGLPVNDFVGESWAGLDAIQNNTGYPLSPSLNDPGEGEMDVVIAGLANALFLSSEFEMYPGWLGSGMGTSPWVFASNDPAWLHVVEYQEVGTCRMTGGQNRVIPAVGIDGLDTWGYEFEQLDGDGYVTTGGQIGAPSGGIPRGHWTHQQHGGPVGSFTFHSGTKSAPKETEISTIECADPGWCVQARCAPFKQIFWTGIGNFHWKDFAADLPCADADKKKPTLHFYRAMVGDFGENKRPTREDALVDENPETCDWFARLQAAGWPGPPGPYDASLAVFLGSEPDEQFGDKGGQICDMCPDFYQIEIHCTTDPNSEIIYTFEGFIDGGNYQIHPETGQQCPATPELVPELFESTKKVPPGQNK